MTRTDFLNRVRALIEREQMLSFGDSVLVGLSGGADSVALLRVLLELREEYGIRVSCAHIHHGLRKETARRDMEFCEDLCKKMDVPLVTLCEDVAEYAKKHHLCLEDAGRRVRYAFFNQQSTDKIAVAHHKDDNAETVLMNLVKGNLPLGIAPRREKIIRPLLCLGKEEIYAYLNGLGQDYVTDETNLTADYTRNQIRLDLIPYIRENFNKNFTNTVYHSSDVLYREQQYLEENTKKLYRRIAKEENGSVLLPLSELANEDEVLVKRILRYAYHRICKVGERISYEQLERVFRLCRAAEKGKQISLPGGISALISGDFLRFGKTETDGFSPVLIPVEQDVFCGMADCYVRLSKEKESGLYCYPIRVQQGENVTLRRRCEGDKLYFHNVGIHKKLSDFFIDKKIPLHERDCVPLICVNDSVRAVAGHFYEDVTDCPKDELYYIIFK